MTPPVDDATIASVAQPTTRPRTDALVSLARVTTVAMLAGRGGWFVQAKVLLGLPMLGAAGLTAALTTGPRPLPARRDSGNGR
jgi:hypothetical protein